MPANETAHLFDYLQGHRVISLTTYRKNRTGVPTPVEFARKDDKLYISTRIKSYKVKRIRRNSAAELAPCSMRGKLKGPKIKVNVRTLSKEEEQIAIDTLSPLYQGLGYKIIMGLGKLAFWRKPAERVYLEIVSGEN